MKIIILILLIIAIILFYLKLGTQYELFSDQQVKNEIDVVYTWVDGNNPNHKAKRRRYIGDEQSRSQKMYLSNSDARFNDYDTLKYSIRSIFKYAPWVRNIYIVTDDQIPKWFRQNNRVFIIDHSTVIPKKYLPTFNSHVIEYNLHNIPGLSKYFLYLNDDTMLGNNVYYNDFISGSKIYLRINEKKIPENTGPANNYVFAWINMNILLNNKYSEKNRNFLLHQATICDRDLLKKIIEEFPIEYDRTCKTKFRNKFNIPPIGFSLYNGLYNDSVILNKKYISNHYLRLNNNINTNINNYKLIIKDKPKLVCINDNSGFKPSTKQLNVLSNFLNGYYPTKSICEK